jgi:hypothetical protein
VIDTDLAVRVSRGKGKNLCAETIDDGRWSDCWCTSVASIAGAPGESAGQSGSGGHSSRTDRVGYSGDASVGRVVNLSHGLRSDTGSQKSRYGHGFARSFHS